MASFISHKYKLIFCHIPRTAGTSFYEAIKPYLDDVNIDLNKHTPLKEIKAGQMGDHWDEYLKVAIVRDEEDRFESLTKAEPPNTKANDDYWWSTNHWLCDGKGKMLADILLKFEELPYSALAFFHRLGLPITEFPHLNKRDE